MASIRKEIRIDAPAGQIRDALKDVGALHTRVVPGFVKDTNPRDSGWRGRSSASSFATTAARPEWKRIPQAARGSTGLRTRCPMS